MKSTVLALLIFGLGHPAREPLDPAKAAKLTSRRACDGFGAPEELLRIQVSFPSGPAGAGSREFLLSRFRDEKCELDVKGKCLHRIKAGWQDVWTADNTQPSAKALVPITSCYEWGSKELAQYMLSGWYKEVGPDSKNESKIPWQQAPAKQLSTTPEVYEFTDPHGATARLEITR